MVTDYVGEEFELHCCHEVLAWLVLLKVQYQLVEEGVEHDVFGDIIMLPKYSFKATQDHLSWNLVDLLVTSFTLVVLKQSTYECWVDGRGLRVILLSQSIQKCERIGKDIDTEDFISFLRALL